MENRIQLALQVLQRFQYMLVIHPLRSDNSYRSLHAVPQFIGCGDDTAVLHGLHRRLVSDIHLDACVVLLGKGLRNQLCELLLLLKGADDLLCALLVAELRILENVRRAACVDLHVVFHMDDLRHRIKHISHHLAVDARLLFQPCDQAERDLVDGHSVQRRVKQHIKLQKIFIT